MQIHMFLELSLVHVKTQGRLQVPVMALSLKSSQSHFIHVSSR
jgi:hypothetical protein